MSNIIDFKNYMNQLNKQGADSEMDSDTNLEDKDEKDIIEFKPREQKSFEDARSELSQAVIEDSQALMSNLGGQIMGICRELAEDYKNEYDVPRAMLQDVLLDEGLTSILEIVHSRAERRKESLSKIYCDYIKQKK